MRNREKLGLERSEMPIFVFKRKEKPGYDEYLGAVVSANDEDDARSLLYNSFVSFSIFQRFVHVEKKINSRGDALVSMGHRAKWVDADEWFCDSYFDSEKMFLNKDEMICEKISDDILKRKIILTSFRYG
jgi:hypothetical protein